MESFLIHTYYYFMVALLLGFVVSLILSVWENKKLFSFISESTYYKLAAIIVTGVFVRYAFVKFFPNVFNDEFLYLSTAENMAKTGLSFPYLERSIPAIPWGEMKFLPPYPQLWPVLMSFVFKFTGQNHYQAAANLSIVLSILIPIPAFFTGYFFFEDPVKMGRLKGSGETCGLWAAFFWAFLPVLVKLTGCASTEVASTFFIAVFLAMLFFYFRYPTSKTFLTMILALSLAINGRPENLLYVLLPLPFFIRGKFRLLRDSKNLTALILVLYILLVLGIMFSGNADQGRNFVFRVETRDAFSSHKDNVLANLKNNFLFLWGLNKVNPLIYTLLAIGGFLFLLLRGDDRFRGYFLLGWFAFSYFIFTPFPFGDYSNSNSHDAFRFSLHLYFPMILAVSYCCYALWDLVRRTKLKKLAMGVTVIIMIVVVGSLHFNVPFLQTSHPDGYDFDALRTLEQKLPMKDGNVIMIAERPDMVLMTRYASGIPTVLVQNENDVKTMNPGKMQMFYYCTDSPSELILRNFDIEIYLRHIKGKKQYTIFKLEKM